MIYSLKKTAFSLKIMHVKKEGFVVKKKEIKLDTPDSTHHFA